MIELKHLSKMYYAQSNTITALHDINLHIPRGEIFGVIGRSGAGKSTLIRCVNLLERPTTGEVIVNGDDLMTLSKKSLREHRHQIGMVFQHFNLLQSKSVFENVALPLKLMHLATAEIRPRVEKVLELVGLLQRQHANVQQLSGGQKQRVAIARALTTNPKILLCDEMTSALDPETTTTILKLLKKIQRELGLTVLMITHEMDVIKKIADRVAVLEQGRIIEEGTVLDIFRNPQHNITQRLTMASLHTEVPITLQSKLIDEPVDDSLMIMRIAFVGKSATQPIIDALIKHTKLEVIILQGNLDYVHEETFGVLLIAVKAKPEDLNNAIRFLNDKLCQVEVVGYVSANVF